MQSAVASAIDDFELAWRKCQEAAKHAVLTAFPPLDGAKTPTYCCDVMLDYRQEEIGAGRLCIDNFCRATIEFEDLPREPVAEALDGLFGIVWFAGADGPLGEAGPGTYNYDDELTSAEYEVVFDDHGRARLYISFAPVPEAASILHALTTALSLEGSSNE